MWNFLFFRKRYLGRVLTVTTQVGMPPVKSFEWMAIDYFLEEAHIQGVYLKKL